MARKENMKIEVGSILHGSYGYEASISDFFKVVKRTPKQVVIVKLRRHDVGTGCMEWTAVPTDEEIGKPMRRKVQHSKYFGEYVGINSYENAYVWDGKPVENYNYH